MARLSVASIKGYNIMKINLEIPDWVDGKHLYIMAGIELVAYRFLDGKWRVKTSRCSMCGKCCKRLNCEHLKMDGDKYICDHGLARPFSCCVGIVQPEGCTEKYDN